MNTLKKNRFLYIPPSSAAAVVVTTKGEVYLGLPVVDALLCTPFSFPPLCVHPSTPAVLFV